MGGATATGKTWLGKKLREEYGSSHLSLDDLWVATRHIITASERPALHAFTDIHAALRRPVEELHQAQREVAATLSGAIESLVADYLARDEPVIVEGMWIEPSLAARLIADRRVKSIFLRETRSETLDQAMHARGEFAAYGSDDEERRKLVDLAARFDRWIGLETTRLDLHVVKARPRDDLIRRALAVIRS